MNVLLTGGAGYIGSHTAVALAQSGYEVYTVDNFSNSSPEVIRRVSELTGNKISCFDLDLRNTPVLTDILTKKRIDCVLHFAGYKSVNDSLKDPLKYYENNLGSTISLLEAMQKAGVNKLVYSSSASVYGDSVASPVTEDLPFGNLTNPYSRTKKMCEEIIRDTVAQTSEAENGMKAVILRYFNPVGAHKSGMIGEEIQHGVGSVMSFLTQVAAGEQPEFTIFGGDYDTKDGTCLRDFIHVMDLAEGHVQALRYLEDAVQTNGNLTKASSDSPDSNLSIFNLGTGKPYSVLELVHAFEVVNGVTVPLHVGARRDGDIPALYADVQKANRVLRWKATRTLEDMCRDAWNWQVQNPDGYGFWRRV